MSSLLAILVALAVLLVPLAMMLWSSTHASESVRTMLAWIGAPLFSFGLVSSLYPLIMMARDLNHAGTAALVLLKPLSGAVVLGMPCILATGMGATLRRPLRAFVVAWVLTPILAGILEAQAYWLVNFCCVDTNAHPMGRLPIAFFGILTGLMSGIGAMIIMGLHQRSQNRLDPATPTPAAKRA